MSNGEDLEPGEYGEPGPDDLPHKKSRLIGGLLVFLGVLMAVVLILRPNGITGGREFSLPRRRRPVADLEKARATT